jgi:ABC-2 type transport system permease protein
LSWSDRLRLGELPFPASVVLFGAKEYLVASGGWVLAWTVPARAVLQTAFFTLLGGYAAGAAGQVYALVGSVALAATPAAVNKVTDVIVGDRWQDTMYRLRLGRLPIFAVMLLRSIVYVIEGTCAALVGAVVVGPAVVGVGPTLRLVSALPILALLTASLTCLGLLVAAASVGRRTDVLLGNGAMYLVILCSGAVLPVAQGWLAAIAQGVPLTHGLVALREWMAGRVAWDALAAEGVVALAYLSLAWLVLSLQAHRARRGGFDSYA